MVPNMWWENTLHPPWFLGCCSLNGGKAGSIVSILEKFSFYHPFCHHPIILGQFYSIKQLRHHIHIPLNHIINHHCWSSIIVKSQGFPIYTIKSHRKAAFLWFSTWVNHGLTPKDSHDEFWCFPPTKTETPEVHQEVHQDSIRTLRCISDSKFWSHSWDFGDSPWTFPFEKWTMACSFYSEFAMENGPIIYKVSDFPQLC